MPAYRVEAKIDQIVTKTVELLVEASSKEEAEERARRVLQDYPKPVAYDPMVHRVVTTKAHYWIPKSIDLITEEEQNEAA